MHPDNIGIQFHNMIHHMGETYQFTDDELQKNQYYFSQNAKGAKEVSDDEGKAFNKRMRALTALKGRRIGDESIPNQNRINGEAPGSSGEIKVGELRHSAPVSREAEIAAKGITPKITDKVGSDGYSKRRYGVFLANGYTSGEAGDRANVYRVNVPHHELRVDSGFTSYGQNLYIERTVQPHELEHIGHKPVMGSNPALFNEHGLHSGSGATCTECDKQAASNDAYYKKMAKEKAAAEIAKRANPIAIHRTAYAGDPSSDAGMHEVMYESGHSELHNNKDHALASCPEIAKNPDVKIHR